MKQNVYNFFTKSIKEKDSTEIIKSLEGLIDLLKKNSVDHVAMTVLMSNGDVTVFSETTTDESDTLRVLGAVKMLEQDIINGWINPALDNAK